jgi:hypothetical protein
MRGKAMSIDRCKCDRLVDTDFDTEAYNSPQKTCLCWKCREELEEEVMKKMLCDRINAILGRNCPALGGVSAEAIAIIREMESRLEVANQLFQDISDSTDLDSVPSNLALEGTYVTDSVAEYNHSEVEV